MPRVCRRIGEGVVARVVASHRNEDAAARGLLARREHEAKAALRRGKSAALRAMRACGSEAGLALAEAGHTEAVQAIGAGVAAGLWGARWGAKVGCDAYEVARAAHSAARQQTQAAELKNTAAQAAQGRAPAGAIGSDVVAFCTVPPSAWQPTARSPDGGRAGVRAVEDASHRRGRS